MSPPPASCEVCHKAVPLASQCSGCRNVSYCSKEHQKQDWPRHKGSCPAYKVMSSPKGRYVVATRKINKGDIIVSEDPIVIGPNHSKDDKISCLGCFSRKPPVQCPRCDWPICGPKCPALVTGHKTECDIFSKIKASLIHNCQKAVLPLRCYLLQKTHPEKWKILEEFAPLGFDTSHHKETIIFLEEAILKPLKKTAPKVLSGCSPEKLPFVFQLLDMYSVPFKLPHTRMLGGVCSVTSSMTHCCLPNTHRILDLPDHFLGPASPHRCKVILRAARDISKGEQITIAFVDTVNDTFMRQQILLSNRDVQCDCARCLDPTELGTNSGTIRCTECDGWVLPINTSKIIHSDWKCDKCQKIFPREYIYNKIKALRAEIATLPHRESDLSKETENILNKLQKSLHPKHALCMLLKRMLITMYGHVPPGMHEGLSVPELMRKEGLCMEINEFMKHPCFEESMFCSFEVLGELYLTRQELDRRIPPSVRNQLPYI